MLGFLSQLEYSIYQTKYNQFLLFNKPFFESTGLPVEESSLE